MPALLSLKPRRRTQAPKTGDLALGEYLSALCVGCHQASGRASGGWPEEASIAVMCAYKDGARGNETMRTISHGLSQEDIEALAAYFGRLPARPLP